MDFHQQVMEIKLKEYKITISKTYVWIWLSSLHTYGNVLFNTSYYVKVENGAL